MSYSFADKTLEAIYARKQTQVRSGPLEDQWEPTTWRRIFSRHNKDLGIVTIIYLAALGAAIAAILHLAGKTPTSATATPVTNIVLPIIFGTAIFGTLVELLRRVYDTAIKRLGTIDLFTSEILSIIRVFASANIMGDFVRLYDKIGLGTSTVTIDNLSAKGKQEGPAPLGFADTARKENYFSIFDKNSSDLGSLDPGVVNDITAFYTFLKAARDATGAMQHWKESHYDAATKKEDLVAIVFLSFLMIVHGRLALDRLIASKPNRKIVDDIFAGVQLQCFRFLDHVLLPDDFRRPRIQQRRDACNELQDKYGYIFSTGKVSATPPPASVRS